MKCKTLQVFLFDNNVVDSMGSNGSGTKGGYSLGTGEDSRCL